MPDKYIVTSPEPPLPPVPEGLRTLPEYLLAKMRGFSDKGKSYYLIDAITKEKRYFSMFDIETKKIASALYKTGLRKGGAVLYMSSEMSKLHVFLAGAWRANGVCRASYSDDDPATLEFRIKESEIRHILCDINRVDTCTEAIKNVSWPVKIITTTKAAGSWSLDDILEEEDGTSCPELEVTGDDPALMLCTSGTTGPPKAAVLTHFALVQHVHLLTFYPFSEDKPNLMFSTGTHYSGTAFNMGVFASGKTSIVTGKITVELIHKTIQEMKPGVAFAFPSYLLTLVGPNTNGQDFSSLDYLFTAGGMVTAQMKQALLQLPNVKDVVNCYGLSEGGILITNARLRAEPNSDSSTYPDIPDSATGRPYPGCCVQVLDLETLEPLGPHQRGEVCAYNTSLFHSYYNNPEATKKSFIGKYMRTGDVGYYDEQGILYVVDRFKEIFKYYNNHISPSELENLIGQHPFVNQVCVVGINDAGGQVPRAFVTVNGSSSPEIAEAIKNDVNAKLPAYKQLRGGLYIVPELPKGNTGKVVRSLVAEIKV